MRKVKWWWLLVASIGFFIASMALPSSLDTLGTCAFLLSAILLVWSIVRLVRGIKNNRSNTSANKPSKPISFQQQKKQSRGDSYGHVTTPANQEQLKRLQSGGYVVFDVETTGLDPHSAKVIEYAMLKHRADGTEDARTGFCDPGMLIPDNIKRLTGISDKDVAGQPHFSDIAEQLIRFTENLPIVAHNGRFDAAFLSEALNDAGITTKYLVYDTLAMSKRAFPGRNKYTLESLIRDLNLWDQPQTHRALDDVRCTQALLLKCIDALLQQPIKRKTAHK